MAKRYYHRCSTCKVPFKEPRSSSYCRECHRARSLAWVHANPEKARNSDRQWKAANRDKVRAANHAYYEANSERINAQTRAYREANPERTRSNRIAWEQANADRMRSVRQAWYNVNYERVRAAGRAYYETNAERLREQSRIWAQSNPENRRETKARRRARKKGATVGVVDWAAVREQQRGLCATCDTFIPSGYEHKDHWIPLEKGGPHSTENAKILCYRCNTSKGAKMPEEFKPKPVTKKKLPDQPHLLNPDWTAPGYR